MKASTGDILAVSEVRERKTSTVKNCASCCARARAGARALGYIGVCTPSLILRLGPGVRAVAARLAGHPPPHILHPADGLTLKYNSRSGTHNMYKEYRAVSLCSAVDQVRGCPATLLRATLLRAAAAASDASCPLTLASLPPPPPPHQMYAELAGRHRARFNAIQIVDTRIVPAGKRALKKYNPEIHGDVVPEGVKRPSIKQFIDSKIKFPLPHRIQRAATKSLRSTFNASRPSTFFH